MNPRHTEDDLTRMLANTHVRISPKSAGRIPGAPLGAVSPSGAARPAGDGPVMTEAAFMQAIIDYARRSGWLVYHTYSSKRSEPGFPDLVMLSDGQCVVAEVKTEKGKVTRAQSLWLDGCRQAGIEAHVWRPSDWEAIKIRLG